MGQSSFRGPIALLDELAAPLRGPGILRDYDPLLEIIGDARIVLLGEATHGTHEFYRARARISERLIRERGFSAIAVEADWPDAYRVNRYVRGIGGPTADDALDGFRRFPQWMWRNSEVVELIHFLSDYNGERAAEERVGFYGLDVYSLHGSMAAVVEFLAKVDPHAARAARERYACFDVFGEDVQTYGYLASLGVQKSCEDEAVSVLVRLREQAVRYLMLDGALDPDDRFSAEQNARVVANAERYYREMFRGRESSWNLRDTHMADTLDALLAHLERQRPGAKLVVWAHNSHIGDARATSMSRQGELNLGQLLRERHDRDLVSVGFTTYDGEVAAASSWDGPVEKKQILPAREGSVEWLFHRALPDAFILDLRSLPPEAGLHQSRLERAIGVIYRPLTELVSHYFHTILPEQFDAVIHFDHTRAVTPLERRAGAAIGADAPDTHPSGI
jgi:erythromycin esterase-like protein